MERSNGSSPSAPPRSSDLNRPLRISKALLDDVVEHAYADAPNECCGLISSRDGEAVAVYRTVNTAKSKFKYVMDPREQLRITDEIEDAGLDLGMIYHSHTRSDPIPSETDVNLARFGDTDDPAWPGTLYLIVGTKNAEPDLRLWSIVGRSYEQVELEVTD
ncbi:Mov34/MPN/PAD-1 family protein [Solirubrobacter soli]|uniref:Mov34/MPN/PAD-1 family protein n=1 Tax=Solirubrobacter soli TaxID=363832 RepID=UPI001FDFFD67|nr:M67 family metallopeptidase [Solirubrobacter soli]